MSTEPKALLRSLIFLGAAVLTVEILCPSFAKASLFHHKPKAGPVHEDKVPSKARGYSEKPGYLVVFHLTGESRQDQGEGAKKWLELGYKLVNESENPADLFGPYGWAEVRFRDKEGYTVTADKVPQKNMTTHQEYYGFIWVEAGKASSIAEAEVRALGQDEIPLIPESKPSPEPAASPSPSPAVSTLPASPSPTPAPQPSPEISLSPSPVLQTGQTSPEPSNAPLSVGSANPPAPENTEKKMLTESEVREELKTVDAQPPTKVEFPPLPGGSPEELEKKPSPGPESSPEA